MSSFAATLKVNGKDFEVINCSYSFSQNTDQENRPAGKVMVGQITLSILGDDDKTILEWMADPYKMQKGSIEFNKIDEASTLKKIEFEDAYCTNFSEGFAANVADSMVINFTISPRIVTANGVKVVAYEKK